ncbi:Coiled-coil domain-containing protein 75 [Termitomyces sp. J132]|nr:Coiled-coil domain-containing protein 75 [Termitomyces sp. J132]
MMKKMGFKPGQALGKVEEPVVKPVESSQNTQAPAEAGHSSPDSTTSVSGHIVKPIPLNEWQGKKGIGLGKRAASPSASAGRAAKMAKMAEEAEVISHRNFRNRARREYEEKRAEGRLVPAQRTCVTLDEKAGKTFHVLWLNPNNPDSFPEGLVDALALRGATGLPHDYHGEAIQVRLRKQMEADALHPLDDALTPKSSTLLESFSLEVIEKAMQYLRLQAQDRLSLVLAYLRDVYKYCFWCGVQYEDEETMQKQCPGPDEKSHV